MKRRDFRSNGERFWSKTQVNDWRDCWLWKDAAKPNGYGGLWLIDEKRWVYAHRFSYELLVGPIPDGLTIDHLCRVRCCVNPLHLEAVTLQENIRRAFAVRPPLAVCHNGHDYADTECYIGGRRCCSECRRLGRLRYRPPLGKKPGFPQRPLVHGTVHGYQSHRCRCDECRAAHSRYVKARRRAARSGAGL